MPLFVVCDGRTRGQLQSVLVSFSLSLQLDSSSQTPPYRSSLGKRQQDYHWRGRAVEIVVHNHAVL